MPPDHRPEAMAQTGIDAWLHGVAAADGTKRVTDAVRSGLLDEFLEDREDPRRIQVFAIGKAAPTMVWGLVEAGVPIAGVGVSPARRHRPTLDHFQWLDGDHPVPGDASFHAGQAVLDHVRDLDEDAPVLVLLSGGASACLEVPAEGVDRQALVQAWQDWHRTGMDIVTLNQHRKGLSALKGGGLGRAILDRTDKVQTWMIADTPEGTEAESVGSGPCYEDGGKVPHHVLASNEDLIRNAAAYLAQQGYSVFRHTTPIQGEVAQEVDHFHAALATLPTEHDVALIGGGEPTVALPVDAPPGGRCQHAALTAARFYGEANTPGVFLALQSDGIDGQTKEAGAWTDATDWGPEAEDALQRFAAHDHLASRDRTVRSDHTGTNVADLWIALRPRQERGAMRRDREGRVVTAT